MGEVGSGKSTLMAGILGEVPVFRPTSGNGGSGGGDAEEAYSQSRRPGMSISGSINVGGYDGGGDGDEGSSRGWAAGASEAPREGVVANADVSGGESRAQEDPGGSATNTAVRVCYAAQAPWIMSGTVRENVLFGLPMDQERYRRDDESFSLGEHMVYRFPNVSLRCFAFRFVCLSSGSRPREV